MGTKKKYFERFCVTVRRFPAICDHDLWVKGREKLKVHLKKKGGEWNCTRKQTGSGYDPLSDAVSRLAVRQTAFSLVKL